MPRSRRCNQFSRTYLCRDMPRIPVSKATEKSAKVEGTTAKHPADVHVPLNKLRLPFIQANRPGEFHTLLILGSCGGLVRSREIQ